MSAMSIDNNRLEVRPSPRNKRKVSAPLPSAYTNPALDLLADEDRIDNATMEVRPSRKRKRTRSHGEATFENTALDLGTNKVPASEFLVKELENVTRNCNTHIMNVPVEEDKQEPLYMNLTELKNVNNDSGNVTQYSDTSNTAKQIFINNQTNISLSFIEHLESTSVSNHSLYLDDDLNESNIMEIKTITIVTKKKRDRPKSTNPFLNSSDEFEVVEDISMQENPFLNKMIEDTKPVIEITENMDVVDTSSNAQDIAPNASDVTAENNIPSIDIDHFNIGNTIPFIDSNVEPTDVDETSMEPSQSNYTQLPSTDIVPRRLFIGDTNSTVSTVNDLSLTNIESQPEYENIDFRPESPIYSNIEEVYAANVNYNKQSKVLGHDVSSFNSRDILNLNPRPGRIEVGSTRSLSSNDTSDSKKHDLTHHINKLSKKVFKKIKKTFSNDKPDHNTTLNPYEVPRKAPKLKSSPKEAGFENPALNLNYSDEMDEIEDDPDHLYETVKTERNTRRNMNVTPLRECNREVFDNGILNISGRKQVRFDSTLNQEKVITGNSFEGDLMSPGLDAQIDDFHDELENCINEKKFIAQNM